MIGYLYLALAIGLELVGTACLKYAEGFTKFLPSAGAIIFYSTCFFFLSKSLTTINLSVAYATWSGVGIVAAAIISALFFSERVNAIGIVGMILVVSGVIIMNLFGKAH